MRVRLKACLLACILGPAALTGCGEAQTKFEKEVTTEERAVACARETIQGGYELISTAELKELIDKKQPMVLIDSMPFEGSYAKEHIAGAKNFEFPIPIMEKWDGETMGERTEEQYAELLGPDKKALVIVYCGFVKCTRSHNAAVYAKKLGYTNVKRHPGGIYAWKGRGFPTRSAE